jgi:MFS-type transporter involved in bile tolerance (Atg22 family)
MVVVVDFFACWVVGCMHRSTEHNIIIIIIIILILFIALLLLFFSHTQQLGSKRGQQAAAPK